MSLQNPFRGLGKRLEKAALQALDDSARQGLDIAKKETRASKVLRRESLRAARQKRPARYVSTWQREPAKRFASGEVAAFLTNEAEVIQGAPAREKAALAERIRRRVRPIARDAIESAIQKEFE